ncbi:hypothetical protein GCM10028820_31290 [Tessaracoccus terricola]
MVLAFLLAVTGLGPVVFATTAEADGPAVFANASAISASSPAVVGEVAPATPYPSKVTVSGMNGAVSDVSVTLTGLTHLFVNDLDVLLVGPGGQNVVLMSDVGESTYALSASGAVVTLTDGAAQFPDSGTLASGSYAPSDETGSDADVFPAPAPPRSGAGTFADAFAGIDPNGDWSLYVVDDFTGDDGVIAGGWSLTVTTTDTAAPVDVTAAFSVNPAFSDAPNTLVAEVTSNGQPVTEGTITVNGAAGAWPSALALDANGRVQWPMTSSQMGEGTYGLTVSYSGSANYLAGSVPVTFESNNRTAVTAGLYCNPGGIQLPAVGAPLVYPQRIFVEDRTGTIADVRVHLNGLSHEYTDELDVLLVSPSGASLVLLSDVPGAGSALDLVIADDGGAASNLSVDGTFRPTNLDNVHDTFPAPAPTPSTATTFAEAFGGTPAAGTWELYVIDNVPGSTPGALAGGWCLELSTTVPTAVALDAPITATTGEDVSVTATVTADGAPVTTGSVSYSVDGATAVAAGTPDEDGEVTFTLPGLARGSHTIAASYTGDGELEDSVAAPVTVSVQSGTALELVAATPLAVGEDLVVTATVTAEDGPVTAGSVSYSVDGGTPVVADALDADGEVTFTVAGLGRGNHTVAATYTGADGWTDSTATTLSVPAQSGTTLALDAPTSIALGEDLTLTATITASDGPVTAGSVSYSVDGGTPVVAGSPDTAGEVTFTVEGLARGNHTIVAAYTGADGWTDSREQQVTVLAESATTLTVDAPASLALGEDLSMSALVTTTDGPVTAGSVSYTVDGGTAVVAGVPNADGLVTFTLPGLVRGTHTIDVAYTGAGGWSDSTAQHGVSVQSGTTMSLDAPATIGLGDDLAVTATVTAGDGPVSSGTVSYTVDGGAAVPAGAVNSNGSVTLTLTGLARGEHTIRALYTGAGGWTDSTAVHGVSVQSATTIALTGPTTLDLGADLTVSATVTATDGPVTAGSVAYSVDGGTAVVAGAPNAEGVVTFTVPDLGRGAHTIDAVYTGAGGWTDSTAQPHAVSVESATAIALVAPTTMNLGDDLTVTATVSASDGPVSAGTVSYSVDGGAALDAGAPDADGVVTFTVTSLNRGTHTIDAVYTGAEGWTDSTAQQTTVSVQSATTVVLDAPAVLDLGDDLTVTATASAADGPVSVGTVSYSIDGGESVLAGAVDPEGVVTFTLPDLARGAHTIDAVYSGAGGWTGSTAEQVSVSVYSGTAIVLDAPAVIDLGADPTVTATVSAADGPVSAGTVSYTVDGGAPVEAGAPDADGAVTFTLAGLERGTHTIDAVYTGADGWTDSFASQVAVEVEGATVLDLTVPPTAIDGQEISLVADVTAPAATPTGSVTFLAGGVELGTVTLSGGTAQLEVTLAAGVYTVSASYAPEGGFDPSAAEADIDVLPLAGAGGPYDIAEGEGITLTADGSSAGAAIGWDLDGDGDFSDASGREVTLTWAELEAFGIDDGPVTYDISVRAEVQGLTTVAQATLAVSNTAPAAIVDGPRTAAVGEPLTLKVSADDPSSADMAALFTYLVDWGDGTPVVEVVGPADPPVTHTYTAAGTYEATFTVVDRDGGQGSGLVIVVEATPAQTEPTEPPSQQPSETPSQDPTGEPSEPPAAEPTGGATEVPSQAPTSTPTVPPSQPRPGLPSSGGQGTTTAVVALTLLLVATGLGAAARGRRASDQA